MGARRAASSSAAIASTSAAQGREPAPQASSNRPPTMPPPAMATFQTVARIDCATSAPGPAASAEAVCSRVGEPPNATPQAATATYTAGACVPASPSASTASAKPTRLSSVSARSLRSISIPLIHTPASEARPNVSNTRSVCPDRPAGPSRGAT